jgi:hypothetical protein
MKRAADVFARAIRANPSVAFDTFDAEPSAGDWTFTVDASGRDGGGGATYDQHDQCCGAFHFPWPEGWTMDEEAVSSGLQELATIGVAISISIGHGTRFVVWTDSSAAVNAVARGSSSVPAINRAVQFILEICATHGVVALVCWHRRDSLSGRVADHLSHGHFSQAGLLDPRIVSAPRMQIATRKFQVFAKLPTDLSLVL